MRNLSADDEDVVRVVGQVLPKVKRAETEEMPRRFSQTFKPDLEQQVVEKAVSDSGRFTVQDVLEPAKSLNSHVSGRFEVNDLEESSSEPRERKSGRFSVKDLLEDVLNDSEVTPVITVQVGAATHKSGRFVVKDLEEDEEIQSPVQSKSGRFEIREIRDSIGSSSDLVVMENVLHLNEAETHPDPATVSFSGKIQRRRSKKKKKKKLTKRPLGVAVNRNLTQVQNRQSQDRKSNVSEDTISEDELFDAALDERAVNGVGMSESVIIQANPFELLTVIQNQMNGLIQENEGLKEINSALVDENERLRQELAKFMQEK